MRRTSGAGRNGTANDSERARLDHTILKSNPSRSISKNKLICLAAFTALFLIYLAFPTKNYYYDGIFFARSIEEANSLQSSLIHPNHLLYTPIGYLAYRLTQTLSFTFRAIQVLQVLNSVASVLSAYVLFRIARETFQSRYLAWCVTFLFAFSATWWRFSIDADAYVISVLFLLIAFYLIQPTRAPRPLLLIATFSLAVFSHQLAVLFYPVIILGIHWQTSSSLTGRRRSFIVLQFAVGSFVFIFTAYCYAFYLAAGTFGASRFARWITSYSPDASFSFNVLDNLRYTLRGQGRLFFGGRFGFIKDLGPWVYVPLLAWFALIGVFFMRLIQTLRSSRVRRPAPNDQRFRLDHFARLCTFWIAIYVVFLFFWLPHNTFYRLFYLPALILLGAWFFSKISAQSSPVYRLALFVAIMTLANFLFSILPYARIEKNPPLSLALELKKEWPPGTVVYYASENSDNNLVRYFNPNTEWRLLSDYRQLSTEVPASYNQGKTVWLETTAVDRLLKQPEGTEWLARHIKLESSRGLVDRAYRIRFLQLNP
jgi:hypothetical protein